MPKVGNNKQIKKVQPFILTYGRSGRQTTYDSLSPDLRSRAILVVQNRERKLYGKFGSLLVLPPKIKTISPTRQYVLEYADKNSIEKIVMLDDDLTFSARRDEDVRLFAATDEEVDSAFNELSILLESYLHAGISAREGNNHVKADVKFVGRMVRVLGYRPTEVLDAGARFDRIQTKQDFDMTLQLLRKGYKNAILYKYAQNQRGSQAEGGVSHFRTAAVMERDSYKLESLHPEFVSVVTKSSTSSSKEEWANRVDVRIAWKRAFESSKGRN